jgi:hypothetical protein
MEIGYINGLDLGVGFNTATYDINPTPALDNVTAINPVINAGGQQVVFRVELASSTLSLSEQLSISGRASLKYGITNSGSAKDIFKNSNEPIKKVFRGFNEIDTSNIFLRKIKHFTDF